MRPLLYFVCCKLSFVCCLFVVGLSMFVVCCWLCVVSFALCDVVRCSLRALCVGSWRVLFVVFVV